MPLTSIRSKMRLVSRSGPLHCSPKTPMPRQPARASVAADVRSTSIHCRETIDRSISTPSRPLRSERRRAKSHSGRALLQHLAGEDACRVGFRWRTLPLKICGRRQEDRPERHIPMLVRDSTWSVAFYSGARLTGYGFDGRCHFRAPVLLEM